MLMPGESGVWARGTGRERLKNSSQLKEVNSWTEFKSNSLGEEVILTSKERLWF